MGGFWGLSFKLVYIFWSIFCWLEFNYMDLFNWVGKWGLVICLGGNRNEFDKYIVVLVIVKMEMSGVLENLNREFIFFGRWLGKF